MTRSRRDASSRRRPAGCLRGCTSRASRRSTSTPAWTTSRSTRRRPRASSSTTAGDAPAGARHDRPRRAARGRRRSFDGQGPRRQAGRRRSPVAGRRRAARPRRGSATPSTASPATTRAATGRASSSSAATCRRAFHIDKRSASYPDGQIFDTITNGIGPDAAPTAGRSRRPTAGRSSPTSASCETRGAPTRGAARVERRDDSLIAAACSRSVLACSALVAVAPCGHRARTIRHEYNAPDARGRTAPSATPREQGIADEKAPTRRPRRRTVRRGRATARSPSSAAASRSGSSRSSTCCSRRSCSRCRSSRSSSSSSATCTERQALRPRWPTSSPSCSRCRSRSRRPSARFLTFMLIMLYPKFTNYLMSVFSPTFLPYVLLFFFEACFLYTYYYGWGKFSPARPPAARPRAEPRRHRDHADRQRVADVHDDSPGGVSERARSSAPGTPFDNYTWMPINIHRFIANIAFGGSIAGAYAAFKFLRRQDRRGARPLRLDGLHRQLRRDQRVPAAALRRLLARARRSTRYSRRWA